MKYKWKSQGNAYGYKTGYTSGNWKITRIEGGLTCWKITTPTMKTIYKRSLANAKRYCEDQKAH